MEQQLELRLREPQEIDLDGRVLPNGIRLIGKALQQFDGSWISLADVNGCLARVELKVRFG